MAVGLELLDLLDRRVAGLRNSRPDLDDVLRLQELLVRASLESARLPHAPSFALPREHLVARIHRGVPLLHDQPAFVDVQYAADLFSRLADALERRDDRDLQVRLQAIMDSAGRGALDPGQLFGEAFVQHDEHLADIATRAGVDADLLIMLARQAVAPLLRAYAPRLVALLEGSDGATPDRAVWTRGYCPICGGWPILGELRGVELAQWLRCSACGTAWRTQRLACPYCTNDDFRSLGSLTIEADPFGAGKRFRISVCERCMGYLKVGNAFDPTPSELLPLDDVASLHLDVAAIERGYHRPTGSGFAIALALPEAEWVEELT